MLGAEFTVERVCGLPFIEQPLDEEVSYVERTFAGLASVQGTSLAARREECRAVLERVRRTPNPPAA